MDVLRIILLILHFVGLAMLFGGFLVQQKAIAAGKGTVLPIMWRGALTQIVTGILLVATIQIGDLSDLNNVKLAVKLLVGEQRIGDEVGEQIEAASKVFVQNSDVVGCDFAAGERVDVAADGVAFDGDLAGGSIACAFEERVLDEVRDAVERGRFMT